MVIYTLELKVMSTQHQTLQNLHKNSESMTQSFHSLNLLFESKDLCFRREEIQGGMLKKLKDQCKEKYNYCFPKYLYNFIYIYIYIYMERCLNHVFK